MGKTKTSTKQKKQPTKSTPKKANFGGMVFEEFSPSKELAARSKKEVMEALAECLMDGDKEAFQEILGGYLRAREITKTAKAAKLSRTVIYEAIDPKKNPSIESIFKIMKAFSEVKETKRPAA
ncbi:DNA-binding protein [Bdellovibrio bacteriovorus]|uniref:helix-turn-helix domain-containing transcriptional regulator n=1 Tax=Bdellovibrio bacteriovorus TaxID=959 RepID=UPI003AA8133F